MRPLAEVPPPPSQNRWGVVWQIRWLHSTGHLLCSNHSKERQRRIETTSVISCSISRKSCLFPFAFYSLSYAPSACTTLSSHLISPPLSFILLFLSVFLLLYSLFCLSPPLSLHHFFILSLLFLCLVIVRKMYCTLWTSPSISSIVWVMVLSFVPPCEGLLSRCPCKT